jgi:hypothetical protein
MLTNFSLVLKLLLTGRLSPTSLSYSLDLIKDMLLVDRHRYYPLILKHGTKSVVGP